MNTPKKSTCSMVRVQVSSAHTGRPAHSPIGDGLPAGKACRSLALSHAIALPPKRSKLPVGPPPGSLTGMFCADPLEVRLTYA